MANRSATLFFVGMSGLVLTVAASAIHLESNRTTAPPAARSSRTAPLVDRPALREATGLSNAFISIADAVTPAVVRIVAEHRSPEGQSGWLRDFLDPRDSSDEEPMPLVAGGSGFLVSADGYILTNNHVIEGADRITVALADKRTFDATVVGRDPTTDVAVIKVDAHDLPAVRLGDSDAARVGEWVVAIGNPGFDDASTLDFTVTSGIISAKGRPLHIIAEGIESPDPDAAGYAIEDFIQTDAVINPGNSGGPLVNLAGAVIGINTAIASTTGFNQGYGFAIPSNLAQRVMRDLRSYGHVRRALLGVSISDVTAEDAEAYGLPSISGVLVEDFPGDSPGHRAGLERHDVIVAVDGRPVERVGQLQRVIAQREPGQVVSLDVVRWGEPRQLAVRLAQAPIVETAALPASRITHRPADLGLEVTDEQTGSRVAGVRVVVSAVAPIGPADRKGISAGDVLLSVGRSRVRSARDARELLRQVTPGHVASLLLQTPQGRTYIANVRRP